MKKQDVNSQEKTYEEIRGEQFLQSLIDENGLEQLQIKQKKFVQRKFENKIPNEFKCSCDVCQELHRENKSDITNVNHFIDDTTFFEQYFKIQEKENLNIGESVQSQKQNLPSQDKDKDYNFILKRLIPPQKLVRNIRLFIPETMCYIGGELKLFAYTNYVNRTIKFNNPKEKLSLRSKKEVMSDRRQLYKQQIESKLQEQNNEHNNQNKNENSPQSQQIYRTTVENHSKEAYIVCFEIEQNDKTKKNQFFQYSSLLNETEFFLLQSKRKIDPIWSSVMYISNYLALKKSKFNYQRFSFKYEKQKHEYLFKRALADVQMMSGDLSWASHEYVRPSNEEQFEDKLMQISPLDYCRYMTYKIAHFVEIFHYVRIVKMKVEWLQDDIKNMYFMNALNVVHRPTKKAYDFNEKLQMKYKKDNSNMQVNEEKYQEEQRQQIIDMFTRFIKMDQQNSKLSDRKFKEANKKSDIQQNLNLIKKSKNPILDLKKILLQENMQNLGLNQTKQNKRPSTQTNRYQRLPFEDQNKQSWKQGPTRWGDIIDHRKSRELKPLEKIKYSTNQNNYQLQYTSSLYQKITSKQQIQQFLQIKK